MIETEVKLKTNKKEIERIGERLGKPAFFNQKNLFFKINGGNEGGFLRIRDEKGRRVVTTKGKRLDGVFNSREENELSTNLDFEQLACFFEDWGFKKILMYEKQRAEFELNECVLAVDILPNSETYLEIEGSEENIHKNMKLLGLDYCKIERRSYLEILGNGKE